MATDLLDRIVSDPNVIGGQPHIKGTRISVYNILKDLAAGRTIDDFLENHPDLEADDIFACLLFAAELVDIYYANQRT
jgi:uncharacterized protein (DUF433 family)